MHSGHRTEPGSSLMEARELTPEQRTWACRALMWEVGQGLVTDFKERALALGLTDDDLRAEGIDPDA